MNGKKAKELRRIAKELMERQEGYTEEETYFKGSDKRNIEKLKEKSEAGIPVFVSPIGTIKLGKCLKKIEKLCKKQEVLKWN